MSTLPDIPATSTDIDQSPTYDDISSSPERACNNFPPRPSSPPLPPRKNARGLPPTYLRHLRRLLRQWLEQQVRADGSSSDGQRGDPDRLWAEDQLDKLEKAIWSGAVVPSPDARDNQSKQASLLELQWDVWAAKSARRKESWKANQASKHADTSGIVDTLTPASTELPKSPSRGKASRKTSVSDASASRGRLTVPSSPLQLPLVNITSSSPSASSKQSRAPSVASANLSPVSPSASRRGEEDDQAVEQRKEWSRVIAGLNGFERYIPSKRDEWEVVDDDLPKHHTITRDIPGAFPQSSNYDFGHRPSLDMRRDPAESSTFPRDVSSNRVDLSEIEMVKPVFCVHFAASSQLPYGSSSTLKLRRDNSIGARSTGSTGSGSGSGRRWWSGSGARWSELTAGPERNLEEDPVIEFMEGLYALPTYSAAGSRRGRRGRSGLSAKQRRSVMDAFGASPTPSATKLSSSTATDLNDETEGSMADDGDDDEDASSTWSGTQEASASSSRASHREVLNFVLSGADDDIPREDAEQGQIALVGGTMVVRGVKREEEREALKKVLQLLLYTIQTMMLELELLDAFRIPREADESPLPPKPANKSTSIPQSPSSHRQSTDLQRKGSHKERGERTKGFFHRLGKESKGVWEGLLGKRRTSVSHQDSPAAAEVPLPITPTTPLFPQTPDLTAPKTIESVSGLQSTSTVTHPIEKHLQVLSHLENMAHSASPAVVIPMPPLLLRVREEDRVRREKAKQEMSEENALTSSGAASGLPTSSLLGLSMSRDITMSTPDPVRGRALGYRLGGDVRAGLGVLASGADTFEGWIRLQRLETLYSVGLVDNHSHADKKEKNITICQRPVPTTLVFWDESRDQSIEDYVYDLANGLRADESMICTRTGCTASEYEHVRWWVHAGKRVGLRIEFADGGQADKSVDVWIKCSECEKVGEPRCLGDGARSYSWGKLLELLIYTTSLVPPSFCPHATPNSTDSSPVNHYIRADGLILSLSVESVPVLDTRLPKLQVGPSVPTRKFGKEGALAGLEGLARKEVRDERLEGVARDIELFFASMQNRVEVLRERLEAEQTIHLDAKEVTQPQPPSQVKEASEKGTSIDCLAAELKRSASALQGALTMSPSWQLNDVRRQLGQQIKVFTNRLSALRKKYGISETSNDVPLVIPDYAGHDKVHALPGSAILFREDEPSSLIAYTLSSMAYFNELTFSSKSNTEEAIALARTTAVVSSDEEASEAWIAEVKRKDTPRDLLSLRTLAKKRSDATLALPSSKLPAPMSLTPTPNAPSLEISLEQVEGKSQSSDRLGEIFKTISKATASYPIFTATSGGSGASTPNHHQRTPAPTHKAVRSHSSTSLSVSESETSAIPGTGAWTPRKLVRRMTNDSDASTAAPPSAFRPTRSVSSNSVPQSPALSASTLLTSPHPTSSGGMGNKEGWGSVTSSFSNSFNQLLKLGTEMGESIGSIRMRGTDRSLSSLIGPMGLSADSNANANVQDDRPHIQFTYTLGDRLKLGCTVYYASAFDNLRRRCAIDRSLVASLSRTEGFNAEGGKSKASFFVSRDKRYLVKELVSKWNVSDTHALLEIAPAYFDHLASTHNKATSLAKIVGFYTVRINDLQTGAKKQLDLLVMENLFYKQTISRTYDLKGIEGRKVVKVKYEKAEEGKGETVKKVKTSGTLFDGEWLEGMQKGVVLVQPHAKRILLEATSLDTRFLSTQSIMDYSLLLGVDAVKSELVVGLVDAIGSYNLFKNIESRGKMVMNRGGEVTIIPPEQYRDRFESALKSYFIACPDKWSKVKRTSASSASTSPSGSKTGSPRREREKDFIPTIL